MVQKQLSAELQELYLKNKEWLSDILFLDEEVRFFRKLFDKVITLAIHERKIEGLYPINISLTKLSEKRQLLKEVIVKHQGLLASAIKDQSEIGMELLNENAEISKEIKSLFAEERAVRKNLYALSENIFEEENKHHLLSK